MRFSLPVLAFLLFLGLQACNKNNASKESVAAAPVVAQPNTITGSETSIRGAFMALSPDQFEKFINKSNEETIIDLRSVKEFSKGHIAEAVNIPFSEKGFEDNVKRQVKLGLVAVYCADGTDSKNAFQILEKLGFKKVKYLDQGYNSWIAASKSVVVN